MPREQKRSAKIISGNETSTCDDVCDVKTFYRRIFFNVIDTVVNCIEDRFARPGYLSSRNIEQLLLNVACRLDYESQLSDVVGVYSDEVRHYRLSTHLQYWKLILTNLIEKHLLVLSTTRNSILVSKENSFRKFQYFWDCILYSQLLVRLVRDQPRLCDIKNWIRNTMTQEQLNHAMLLLVHKESTHKLDHIDITKNVLWKKWRKTTRFGVFRKVGLKLP